MKKILIIQAHPREGSLCSALEVSYVEGCSDKANVETIHLRDLAFDPILRVGQESAQPLEPDLQEAQKKIKECDHMVIIYPTWWGSVPALLKGFIDRVFLSGFAFSYRTNSPGWDKLLSGKTARIVTTMDAPSWYDMFAYRRSGINQIKMATLAFCGIKTIRCHIHAMVRSSSPETRQKWIAAMRQVGTEDVS